MKIHDRVVDSYGNVGVIVGFRQHPYNKDVQEAEINFEDKSEYLTQSYPFRAVSHLHTLSRSEPLEKVLNELFSKASTDYQNAGYSGNDHAQYVLSAQINTLKVISARVFGVQLKL
jgi:hypothetical protein